MSEKQQSSRPWYAGLGLVIFVVFLTLKLAQVGVVANWSWWWVTAPLWIPIGLAVVFLGLAVILHILTER